ncbi:Oleosin [Arabidopsis thaliana x Arabidopsis arenosa]|uniref:Oleosin n=2 Tax=Arabidopsis TaxID=3701 RepID=A0A8T1YUC1_9BRAS|nr:pollen coat oleosin-glycine rich protein [Arabidopsis arenosa]KAG7549884.1 Oleosin [Arabidopsis thaliana x Arabidopsis arenosa]
MFEIIQAVFAAGAALALLTFSAITLGGSVVAFVISTPLFVVFSPVLVPATIATTLLASGFTASGSFGATAFSILAWIYKRRTGRDLPKIPGLTPPAAPASNPAGSGV